MRQSTDAFLLALGACIPCYHVGMKPQAPIQYTIRGVPPEVDRILRRRAAQRKQSLNQLILEELAAAAASRIKKADFSDVTGGWAPDPEFDEIINSQRQIDWDKWK